MVYLQTPRVFQSLMVLSREPETIWRLSAENATLKTSFVWPTNALVVWPLKKIKHQAQHRWWWKLVQWHKKVITKGTWAKSKLWMSTCYVEQQIISFQHVFCTSTTYVLRSHRRRVESQAPDRANCPSDEMTTSLTKWEWPVRERWGIP